MQEMSDVKLDAAADEVLAVLARTSSEAEIILLQRYRKLVRYHARRYAASETDVDDLEQEGMLVLLHIIPKYSEDRGVPFSAFAQTCITNRMCSLAKKAGRNASPVEDIAQLMEQQAGIVEEHTPETILLEKENYEHFRSQVMAMLSAKEWGILQCIMAGASYAQTAERLQISVKSVDNAMQRVRRKMRAAESTDYFQ